MSAAMEPNRHLLLWRLAAAGGEEFLSNIEVEAAKPIRKPLVQAGLLVEDKKVNPAGKTKRPAIHLALSDKGWAWCGANMAWPRENPSKKSARILESLLPRLGRLFESGESALSLGDFISKTNAGARSANDSAAINGQPLSDAIRDACRELGGGQENVRIRLADLRRRLSGRSHEAVTAELLAMSEAGELTLYQLDNPREIGPEDRSAAIHTSTGKERHILYFGGLAS
jgi:hypothetical protein